LIGFGVRRLAQQKEREGAGIPGGCSSPAKGLDEDVTNGTAALQSPPLGKEEQRRRGSQGERVREKGKGLRNRRRR